MLQLQKLKENKRSGRKRCKGEKNTSLYPFRCLADANKKKRLTGRLNIHGCMPRRTECVPEMAQPRNVNSILADDQRRMPRGGEKARMGGDQE